MSTTTVAPIVITGSDARDIRSHVRAYIRRTARSGEHEVQGMRECDHGCKLFVRLRGSVDQYFVRHYAGYGCPLDTTATRVVPVRVLTGPNR